MKRIQILAIPNRNDKIRHISINFYILLLIALVLFLLLSLSTLFIIRNFNNAKNIANINKLRKENRKLYEYKIDFNNRITLLQNNYNNALDKYKGIGEYIYSMKNYKIQDKIDLNEINEINDKLRDIRNMYSDIFQKKDKYEYIPSIAPVKGNIMFKYGRNYDPFTNKIVYFKGVTISTIKGTYVKAAAAGKVVSIGTFQREGLVVVIRHNKEFTTKYGHLMLVKLRIGDKVQRGDIIGKAGETGRTIGPVLYYEINYKGEPIDPYTFISGFLKKDFYSFFND